MKRLCSKDGDFESELQNLETNLLRRGYPKGTIRSQAERARSSNRQNLLQYKKKLPSERTTFAITFSSALGSLPKQIHSFLPVLTSTETGKAAFSSPPMIAFRRNRNLRDSLVHTSFTSPVTPRCGPCNRPCILCPNMESTNTKYMNRARATHNIIGRSDCRSEKVIYCITCKECNEQYIGKTEDLQKRMNNHRSAVKTSKDQPVANHLRGHDLSCYGQAFDAVSICILHHVYSGSQHFLSGLEMAYIQKYQPEINTCFTGDGDAT